MLFAFSTSSFIISIHAPREGSDFVNTTGITEMIIFQSTLPVRGATQGVSEHC